MRTTLCILTLSFLTYISSPLFAWEPKDNKKASLADLKKRLTPLQFEVTQNADTEEPFKNEFWNKHDEGIYVDIVSGEPLFSSLDKFDSGTGWPSFTRPLVKTNLIEKVDDGIYGKRTEIRSKYANSHLGHVFPDGPPPTGLRYCMNSASMRFIPKGKLAEEGYPEFVTLFKSNEKNDLNKKSKNQKAKK